MGNHRRRIARCSSRSISLDPPFSQHANRSRQHGTRNTTICSGVGPRVSNREPNIRFYHNTQAGNFAACGNAKLSDTYGDYDDKTGKPAN